VAAAAIPAASAHAQDPGQWVLTGASSVPLQYWQGLTTDPANRRIYFAGIFEGLWHTSPLLERTAGIPRAIPAEIGSTEGYNHIGDFTWNPGEGGRLILPLECYSPRFGNTCGTGAFGVADPDTLAFRYYVKLDPSEIPKAMWAETSRDGTLIWTSSGRDLLAYRSADVTAARAGPGATPIRAVRRLAGAVPPTGVTGAVFHGGRLLLAGELRGIYQVWSVDTATGERRLVLETTLCGEAEGLDTIRTLGGELHWLIAPLDPGCMPTYGPTSALLHYVRRPGIDGLDVRVTGASEPALPGPVEVSAEVRFRGRPIRGAAVSFAGAGAVTDSLGRATITAQLQLPGRFRVLAKGGIRYGLSDFVSLGVGPPVTP